MNILRRFVHDETGLELSEYGMAAAVIVLGLVTAFTQLGQAITRALGNLAGLITNGS